MKLNRLLEITTILLNKRTVTASELAERFRVSTRTIYRKIEPMRLIFKSQAWYLWGFCLEKHDYRTFRISRIKRVEIRDEKFEWMMFRNSDENDLQDYKLLMSVKMKPKQ